MNNLTVAEDYKSPIAEAYRMIRTNIQFSKMDKKIKTVVITSAGADEGKSTVTANLAIVMAQAGNRVLLIDCDLRKPNIRTLFNLKNRGLSNCVMAGEDIFDVIQESTTQDLDILTSGPLPCYPSELLGSKRMQILLDELGKKYDYILIDTPPVLSFTDAAVISSKADATILLLEWGKVKPAMALEAKKMLELTKSNIIGVILNKAEIENRPDAYGYYNAYYKKRKAEENQELVPQEAK